MKAVRTLERPATAKRTPPPKKRPKKRRLRPVWLAGILLLLVLSVLFCCNGWRVVFRDGGEPERLECPAVWEATPPEARLAGKWLFQSGIPLTARAEGTVDGSRVGRYAVRWRAGFLFWRGEMEQTVVVEDTTPPVITLTPDEREGVLPGEPYDDPGYSAVDTVDGDLTDRVRIREENGVITYTVSDAAGNEACATRTVAYLDTQPPVITLAGESRQVLQVGAFFHEPGYAAEDDRDGDLTDKVTVTGAVDTAVPGVCVLTYTVADAAGNEARATRKVQVTADGKAGKVIYLTFDDGPGPYTNELLDILAKYGVKVTFFVVKGNHTAAELDIITREAAEGHTVAVHSYAHDYRTVYEDEDAFFRDFNAMNEIIYAKTGAYSTMLRFPGGSSNTSSKFNPGIMTCLVTAVEKKGYRYFDWNVSSGDGAAVVATETVYENVTKGCAKRDVCVVLQHDIKKNSVEAVERILQWGLANGYTFLPLTPDSPGAHHRINN